MNSEGSKYSALVGAVVKNISGVSSRSAEKIKNITEYRELDKGEVFINLGNRDQYEYFVLEGVCRSFVLDPEGVEVTIQFYPEMSVLSPYVTRTRNTISNVNFQALTPVIIGYLDARKFEEMMVDDLEIRGFGNSVLKNELDLKVQKEIELASLTAAERLQNFRSRYPSFENLIPHSAIATYLGISPVSLSRLRNTR